MLMAGISSVNMALSNNLRSFNYEALKPSPSEPRPNVNFIPRRIMKKRNIKLSNSLQCGNEPVDIYDGSTFTIRSEKYPQRSPLKTECSFHVQAQAGVAIDLMCTSLHVPCRRRNFLDVFSSATGNTTSFCTTGGVQRNLKIPLAGFADSVDFTFSHRIDGKRAGKGFECMIRGVGGALNPNGPEERRDVEVGLGNSSTVDEVVQSRSVGDCGRTRYTRIISGGIASDEEYPWMAQLFLGPFFCGGSVINHQWILTAAHCSVDIAPENIFVLLGCQDFDCSTGTLKSVSQNIIPASYNFIIHDIALLEMSSPIASWSTSISPVCLPNYLLNTGTELTISGWGVTEAGSVSSTLKEARVSVSSDSNCRPWMRPNFPIVCTSTLDGNSCNGDSGSSVVYLKNKDNMQRYVEYGIVSFGEETCDLRVPSGNTEVPYYLGFIKSIAGPVGIF